MHILVSSPPPVSAAGQDGSYPDEDVDGVKVDTDGTGREKSESVSFNQ